MQLRNHSGSWRLSMYHSLVRSKVRSTFAQISTGNWEPMIKAMAPSFTYRFYGDSALSGERHTVEAVRRWWRRSFRLMPTATLDVLDFVFFCGAWSASIRGGVAVHASFL